MYDFKRFHYTYRTVSWKQFKKNFPHPLLLLEKRDVGKRPQDLLNSIMQTTAMEKPSLIHYKKGRKTVPPFPNSRIFDFTEAIEKRQEIYVGRDEGNFIRLKDPSVSTKQAYFKKDEVGNWILVDLGSQNGTFVNNQKIKMNTPEVLSSGDGITFSHIYYCTFFDSQGFFEYITSLA